MSFASNCEPNLANCTAEMIQIWPIPSRVWLKLGQTCTRSPKFRRVFAKLARNRAKFVRSRPKLIEILPKFGPSCVTFGRNRL